MPPNIHPQNVDARHTIWNDVKGDQHNTTINSPVTPLTTWSETVIYLKPIFEMVFCLYIALAFVTIFFHFVVDVLDILAPVIIELLRFFLALVLIAVFLVCYL